MCLFLIARNFFINYPLIIIANRDEYYSRETKPLGFWENNNHILVGQDLRGGGTWLGVTKTGKIAALTNYPAPKQTKPNPTSRGQAVKEFLRKDISPQDYIKSLKIRHKEFTGFNLLLGEKGTLNLYSNVDSKCLVINSGIHVMTNTALGQRWPKGDFLINSFKRLRNENPTYLIEKYFKLLGPDNREPPIDYSYKNSIFIKGHSYGTRSSSVLMFHSNGTLRFLEKSYDGYQKIIGEKSFFLQDAPFI